MFTKANISDDYSKLRFLLHINQWNIVEYFMFIYILVVSDALSS